MSTRKSYELISSDEENVQKKRKSSINKEENMQREREYLQNYPVSYGYSNIRKWKMFDLLQKDFTSQIHMVMAFECDSALIMTKDNMVYGFGSNYNGRLGLEPNNYTQPEKVKILCGKNIKVFCCDDYIDCIFALTEEGEVYSWGSNVYYRLGREMDSHKTIYMPAKMDSLNNEHIIDIASNYYNSLALTDSGKVYIWGNIEFINTYKNLQMKPYQVRHKLGKKKIIHIACGALFIMALTDNGKLYSWGRNEYGELGINLKDAYKPYPCLITSLSNVKIVKIVCGFNHSLALTTKGEIYSWGANNKGQLGLDEKTKLKIEPTMLDVSVMEGVSDIAAQDNKSVAVSKTGCVYVWGYHVWQIVWKPVKTEYSNIHDIFKYRIPYIIQDNKKKILTILECLGPSFNDISTCDLTIEINGHLIYVHKAILKIRCQYFRNILQEDWPRNDENMHVIMQTQFSYNVYKTFLKYLYTDVVDYLSLEDILELMTLCDEYNETNLKSKSIQIIRETITVANVAFNYAKAIEYNVKDVEELCFQFALSHMTEVVQTKSFAKLSESQKLHLITKAAKAGVFKT